MVEPIKGQPDFNDRRARLSAKPGARELIYGPNRLDNILQPLYETGGLIWPYTPTLFDQASVLYDHYDPMHSNQPFAAFKSVAVKEIVCTGQFTAQNEAEARYGIAALHYLRTITKMYFGLGGADGNDTQRAAVNLRGTPPPILLFNAHGTAVYHNVPVIVTIYNVEFPQDVDYVQVVFPSAEIRRRNAAALDAALLDPTGNSPAPIVPSQRGQFTNDISAWVPTRFTVSVTMQVQNTPDRWRRRFNLNDFRTGALIKKGGWV